MQSYGQTSGIVITNPQSTLDHVAGKGERDKSGSRASETMTRRIENANAVVQAIWRGEGLTTSEDQPGGNVIGGNTAKQSTCNRALRPYCHTIVTALQYNAIATLRHYVANTPHGGQTTSLDIRSASLAINSLPSFLLHSFNGHAIR